MLNYKSNQSGTSSNSNTLSEHKINDYPKRIFKINSFDESNHKNSYNQNDTKNEVKYDMKNERQGLMMKKERQRNDLMLNKSEVESIAVSQIPKTIQQKRKVLLKTKYINQLARLEYEEKQQQIHTKYTKTNKETVYKKIKAKNQIAEFIEEQEEQDLGYDQLWEFAYGKSKNKQFYFEKKQSETQYMFCDLCDSVHNDHMEVHRAICEKRRKEDPESYSPFAEKYKERSIRRISETLLKMKGSEYERLSELLANNGWKDSQNQLEEWRKVYSKDGLFVALVDKILKVRG